MESKEEFLKFIEESIEKIKIHKQLAELCLSEDAVLNSSQRFINYCETVRELVKEDKLALTYLSLFTQNTKQALNYFPFNKTTSITTHNILEMMELAKNYSRASNDFLNKIEFNLSFFEKLGFFGDNIVAIGANGSGKTSLSYFLRKYIEVNGVVISAQRILRLKSLTSIENPINTFSELKKYQLLDKSNKGNPDFGNLQNEFEVVIKNLISSNIWQSNDYKKQAQRLSAEGKEIEAPSMSSLDITFKIWNSLIEHREIFCGDGINISVRGKDIEVYDSIRMSDGEKVILYLIAQVLQAPENGFIVVDEPEMYLHKTILKKLWDRLEQERKDCIFLYLTHDLDFAVSRTTAKKVWIKSFTHPESWEIENIPENEMPESLVLELLGSRKNILFCEGKKGSIDEKIYNILFPEYTITPVDSCFSVINFTKAFNKIGSVNTKAIGLIDSDYHSKERLDALEKKNIFSFRLAEAENLLMVENFLKSLANQLMVHEAAVENIKKEVINELVEKKELQASNYISAKIDYYFKDSNVSKGNTLDAVNQNYKTFSSEININDWYAERVAEIDRIIKDNDYDNAIALFNNKGGLQKIVNKHFNISDFQNRAIKLLQMDTTTHAYLKAHFPEFLKG